MPNALAYYQQGQQAVENNKRNKLLQMQVDNAPAEQERRNKLADLQIANQQQNLDAGKFEIDAARDKKAISEGIAGAGYVIESTTPKREAEQRYPDLVAQMRKEGIDWDSLNDDDVRQIASEYRNQLSAKAGIAPPERFERVEGPRGSVIEKSSRTGALKQVVGPDNTETAKSSSYRQATPEEVAARGLPKNTSAQIDDTTGRFDVVNKPDQNLEFARADKLRDEYNAQSKEFTVIGDSYQRLESVAADPSAAGDLALVFSYMKILDPGSVVREQEFANAQNAAGVPDQVKALYNRVLTGERLPPKQRADFLAQARNLYNGQATRQKVVRKRYENLAKKAGVDVDYVVGEEIQGPSGQNQTPQQPAQQPIQKQAGPSKITNEPEYNALPSGAQYIGPDGKLRQKR